MKPLTLIIYMKVDEQHFPLVVVHFFFFLALSQVDISEISLFFSLSFLCYYLIRIIVFGLLLSRE